MTTVAHKERYFAPKQSRLSLKSRLAEVIAGNLAAANETPPAYYSLMVILLRDEADRLSVYHNSITDAYEQAMRRCHQAWLDGVQDILVAAGTSLREVMDGFKPATPKQVKALEELGANALVPLAFQAALEIERRQLVNERLANGETTTPQRDAS